jgi:transposase
MLRADYPDATLSELSELLLQRTGNWVSRTALCRPKQKLGLNRKKKHGTVAFAGTERVQPLRVEYWEKIKKIEVQNKRILG